jgi:BirA family biotin operon repressor/biotin-[acetyl-CoA-carboxylase] ligase
MQHPVAHYQALPLAVALTVAEAVQRLAPALPPIRIKWPNDLLVNDAKLAGILCIAHDSHPLEIYGKMIPMMIPTAMLIGVGVNVNFPASALGEDLRSPATSLQDLIGPVDLLALTTAVLVGLEEMLEAFDRAGFDVALARRVEERLAWVGERVAGELGGEEVTGNLLGIDENGLLRLETPAGEARRFLPSELRRLRAGA